MSETAGDFNRIYHQQYQEILKEDDGVERAHALSEIVYKPGFENKIAIFPSAETLPGHPINIAFSWGKDALNMSEKFFDSTKDETEMSGRRNTVAFLEDAGFTGYPNVVQVLGKFDIDEVGLEPQIFEVSKKTLEETSTVVGNFIICRDEEITTIIKPGDCGGAVILCEDKNGNPLSAIVHFGRQAINSGIPYQGAVYLKDTLGVDLSKARVFVAPGIGRKNYWISDEPKIWGMGIVERNWGRHIDERTDDPATAQVEKTDTGLQKRYSDVGRAGIAQLIKAGLVPENIEAFDVDAYEASANGEGYSKRYTDDTKKRPGRFVLAVQLKTKIQEMTTQPELKQAA